MTLLKNTNLHYNGKCSLRNICLSTELVPPQQVDVLHTELTMAHYPSVDTTPPELEAAPVEQPFLAAGESSNPARQPLGYHSGRRSYKDAFFLVRKLLSFCSSMFSASVSFWDFLLN